MTEPTGPWHVVKGPAGSLRVYSVSHRPAGLPAAPPASNGEPVLMLCHELPRYAAGATDAGRAYPVLADRLADACGLRVVAGMLRGAAGSEGDFSARGWLEDASTVAREEVGDDQALWLVGFGLGAAIALRTAIADDRVRGVALIAGPADLTAWVANRARVLERCRRSGVISTSGFPTDAEAWAAEIVELSPLDAAANLGERALLVVHGSEDAEVPAAAARALADAASGPVDLRIVPGAGHWLRADPRVVATLAGWLERRG